MPMCYFNNLTKIVLLVPRAFVAVVSRQSATSVEVQHGNQSDGGDNRMKVMKHNSFDRERTHRRRRDLLDAYQHISEAGLKGFKNVLMGNATKFGKSDEKVRLQEKTASEERAETRRQYATYYSCLKKQYDEQLKYLKKPAGLVETRSLQANDVITLNCKTCLPPGQSSAAYGIRWMRRIGNVAGEFKDLPKDVDTFQMDPNGDLHIRDVQSDDAGLYTCFKFTSNEGSYYIEIIAQRNRKRVFSSSEGGPLPAVEELLEKNNLVIYTDWSEWGDCDKCGKNAQRTRIGDCKVKKNNVNEPVRPNNSAALDHWSGQKGGLSCRSSLMPRWIAAMPQIATRSSEIMMQVCYVECVTLPVQEIITDSMGNRLEVVEVAKGFRSISHGTPPPQKPPVLRSTVFADVNKRLVLRCPDDRAATSKVIRWFNRSQQIDPTTITDTTRGRVYVDSLNQFVIQRLTYHDKGPFSCWIYLQHIATIRLRLSGHEYMTMFGHLSYAGVYAIVAGVFIMFCRLCWLNCMHHQDMR